MSLCIVCYLVYILDRMIMLGHKIPDILQFNWNFVPVLDHFSNFRKIALGHIIPEVLLIGWILKLSLDCINIYSYYYSKEAKSLGTFVLPASQSCSISLSIRIKFPAYIYNRASWRSWQSTGFPRDRPGFEPGSCRVYLFSSLLIFTGRKNTYSSPKGKE